MASRTPVKLNPAEAIIRRCGGYGIVALALGIDRTAVYRWTQPKIRDRSGSGGGMIPSWHIPRMIEKFPNLKLVDFFADIGQPAE